MDLNYQCSDALLLTSNGVGTAKVIGNVKITESLYTDGDTVINGNSKVKGNYFVNGTSNWHHDATIAKVDDGSTLTIPAIYSNNVYQTQQTIPATTGTITFDNTNQNLTGTMYLIETGQNLTFNLQNQNTGSHYKAIVSRINGSGGHVVFSTNSTINWTVTGGNISNSGNVVDSRVHNLLGSVIAIMADSQINFTNLVAIDKGNDTTLTFINANLSIGDTFDWVFDGTKWIMTIYLAKFSALSISI